MLVMSRKVGERIILHHAGKIIAEIVLVETMKGKGRIGIEADKELDIDRLEVYLRKHCVEETPR